MDFCRGKDTKKEKKLLPSCEEYLYVNNIRNATKIVMIIDVIIILALIISFILGIRQGIITQIFMLIAIITTAVVAPAVAAPFGMLFTDNELLAFSVGFIIMLLGAIILVWMVAPLFKKLVIGKKLNRINSIIGACVALASMTLFLAVASTMFNHANIGERDTAKIGAFVNECGNGESEEELRGSIDELGKILSEDAAAREYFKPRFVAYETLDESRLFNLFVKLGDNICPRISEIRKNVMAELEAYISEYVESEANEAVGNTSEKITENITEDGTGE